MGKLTEQKKHHEKQRRKGRKEGTKEGTKDEFSQTRQTRVNGKGNQTDKSACTEIFHKQFTNRH